MKRFTILTLFLISLTTSAANPEISEPVKEQKESKFTYFLKNYLTKENIKRNLVDAFNSLTISLDTDIFKIDLYDGLSLKGKYEYEVDKSYIPGQYTRRDRFEFKIDHDSKRTFFPELQSPLFLKGNRKNEVIISRQYVKKIDAMKALPFNVAKLPIRAKYVDRLNEGDFISIPASMALTTGFSYSDVAPVLKTGLTGFYTFAGEFLIQVYKLEDQKVRVKIIAEKKKARGLSFKSSFGVELFSFEILGFDVDHEYKIDWIKLDTSKTKGNIILSDYVFDLKDEEVRKVYNNLFNNVFKFKEAKLLAESLNTDLLDRYYVVNLEDVDRLAVADKDLEAPRVERVFKGHNRYTSNSSGVTLDLDFLKLSSRGHYINNRFNFERLDGSTIAFYYPNYTKRSESKITIQIFDTKEEKVLSYYGLTSSHEDHKFLNVGMNFIRRDNEFRKSEQRRYKKVLEGIVPERFKKDVLDSISLERRYVNFSSNLKMIFKGPAFSVFDKYTLEEFISIMQEKLKGKDVIRLSNRHLHKTDHFYTWQLEREYLRKSKKLAEYFYNIIKSDSPYQEKVEKFTKKLKRLRNEYHVMQILADLLPQDNLEDYLYFDLLITDDSETLVDLQFGTNDYKEIYGQLEYLDRYIRRNGEDLRIDTRIEDIQMSIND
ncbi:hypothetical protein [Halobacteriovorax sp.]|uniref:hypothetical protein n=1 Tax=Halobacteriovorax sp. TaxID=2020862 RepID=UPI003AF24CAB